MAKIIKVPENEAQDVIEWMVQKGTLINERDERRGIVVYYFTMTVDDDGA